MTAAQADPLAGYGSIIEVEVAWGEMDSYAHVNNAVYFRYLESARIQWLTDVGWDVYETFDGLRPVLGAVDARFRREVAWPDRLRIGTRVQDVVDDRIRLEHRLVSTALGEVCTIAHSLVVAVAEGVGGRQPLPERLRERVPAMRGPAG